MRKRIILIALLLIFSIAAKCGGDKTTTHKLAIYTAQSDAALVGLADSVDFLHEAGKMNPSSAKHVYIITQKAAGAVDLIRDRSESGFDKKEALSIVKTLLEDARKAEAEGLIGLDAGASKKFKEITFFTIFTIQSIQAVIEAIKDPTTPTEEIKTAASGNVSFQTGEAQWTELVLILQTAVLRGLSQSRMDQASAFEDGRKLSAELKANLAARIAAIP